MPQTKMERDDSNKKKLQKPTIKTTVKQPTEHPSALRNGHKKKTRSFFSHIGRGSVHWYASGEKSFA